VELSVSDDGVGMTSEVLAHAFEPFFTTKGVGRGTGLGLSVVHGIVTGMGGEVAIESRPGLGTTVRVRLPRRSIFLPPADPAEPIPMGSGQCVLLVDDDQTLRDVGEDLLAGLGYQVVQAEGADDALRLVRERPGDFDLLLTDLVMPGKSGIELAHLLESVAPGLPIVLMTGRLEPHLEEVAREAGIRLVLSKPFHWHEIARVVRQAIDGGA
jgi:CheY-like chemotaxis protein